jgi:dUTP pyrophosphatase
MSFTFSKKNCDAIIPKKAHQYDAGFDISSNEDIIIPPGDKYGVSTGIAISFPNDCYCRIAPRSGLAFKYAIDVLAGVIDYQYTDEIKVILINHGKNDFIIKKGDRIAQLIFEKIYTPLEIKEIPYDELIKNTNINSRGLNGFGSSGIN